MAESAAYRRGVALFDYTAIESDELSFRRGATIVIFGSPEEGWFEGELDGRVGMCPANYLRLDVSSPSEQIIPRNQQSSIIAFNSHEPALAAASPITHPLALQDSSASMCVLSQDNDGKRVFERLYETGVVQVKKRQEEQEEKRIKENEEIRGCNFKAGARSANIAAGRKSDKGNYGEFLYNEGIKSSHVKAEQARQVQNRKRGEEVNGSFQPQINEVSKKLRRDMPVVERLLMLEQVKQEKIERLKKTKEQEETQDLLFTPRILAYPLKEGRQRIWPLKSQAGQQPLGQQGQQGQHHFDTQSWHQERAARLNGLRDKLDAERGATHTPRIDEHSRLLAAATSSRSFGSDDEGDPGGVFSKLHRDAERRVLRNERMGLLLFAAGPASAGHHGNMWPGQALKVESQLRVLDLASRPPTKSPREPRTPGALDGPGRFSLHDEAELRRMRKRFLEEQAAAGEDAARNAPKMDLRSEHLSRERLRRDCRQILDAWEVVDKEGRVHYDGFFQAVDRLVDYALVSEDLEGLSTEEKEVLCDRIWVSISDSKDEEVAGPEGRPGIHSPIPVSTFLDAVIHVLYGESVMVDESEPKEIGKAALGVFEEFVQILAWTKLSSHPTHATLLKAENLGKRLQNLKHDAQIEFAKLMRKCGMNFNDQERDILFTGFDLDTTRSLDFVKFYKEVHCILSPRRKAIVRTLKSFESSNIGAITISDLVKQADSKNPSKGVRSKLEETLNLISEVRKRLRDTTGSKEGDPQERHLLSPHAVDSHGTRSRARAGGQEVIISSPESLSASDTYHERPVEAKKVPPHRSGKRQQAKNLDLGDEIPRHVYLHQLSRKWLEHRFVARQLQDEKEMEHCTFRPQINASEAKKTREESICDRLYELARCKDTGSSEKSWEEREMKECTFRPVINKRRPVSAPVQSLESASEQKHVQRVRQKLLEQKMLSSTAESDNTPSSAGPSVSQRQKPKASKDQYLTSGIPIVLIEINLHDGKVARIPIFKGDDPVVMAYNFCRTHGLGSSSEAKLAQMVADQIAGVEESSLYAAS